MKSFLFCLLVLFCSNVYAETMFVNKVVDGDTVAALDTNNVLHHIRLYGIDAPEKKGNQPLWGEAKLKLSELVLNKNIEIKIYNNDLYGRNVAVLYDGEININNEMVKSGFVVYYPDYCKDTIVCNELKESENATKEKKLGLWSLDTFIKPSEWRKSMRK